MCFFMIILKLTLMKFLRIAFIVLVMEVITFGGYHSSPLMAQRFEKFSNKEGFNQNTINAIEQDRYGFLWYGTPNGLIKYDGYDFKTYTTQSKNVGHLNSNFISTLFNDKQGVLWIGTNLGINVYIPWLEQFHTISLASEFLISHIDVDPLGRIWFSGDNQLYMCELVDIEKGTFKVSENILKDHPNVSIINSFEFKDESTLILGTLTGIEHLSLKGDTPSLSHIEGASISKVTTIEYINNLFWIGTSQGLFKATLDENRLHIIQTFSLSDEQGTPANVTTIIEDHSSIVWIGTKGDGIYKYNQEQDAFEHFTYSEEDDFSLSSKHINALYKDDFDVLWIGTAQGGINKLNLTQKPFITYSSNPYDKYSISDNLITSILEDSRGQLWISGYNSSLFRSINKVNSKNISDLKFENLHSKLPLLDGNAMRCIFEDDKGYIWISVDNIVIVYNPFNDEFRKVTFSRNTRNVSPAHVRKFIQFDENHMILAGNQITVLENPWQEINNKKTPHLSIKSILGLQGKLAQAILQDGEDSFWIGTDEGLLYVILKKNKLVIEHHYTANENQEIPLSYNNIFSLYKENNHLWIGTFGGGLNKMTLNNEGLPSKIEYFRKNDILENDVIYGILQEGDSDLWLSTDMGLVKFNIENYDDINMFDMRDGLAQNNFRQGAYFKGNTGYYYFGGLNGLSIFKPEEIKLNVQVPEILITSLLLNNVPVGINELVDNKVILTKSISETEQILINQDQRIISFNLVVKHTSQSSKNKLAYKLEGFNDDWIEIPTGKTTVTYTNLSAGSYVFRIKAANGDGNWSTEDKRLSIEVLPPWYDTWWSYLLFALIIIFITLGLITYYIQHIKLKERLEYEQRDKERVDTINQGKFRFFTNISHEFRTPLTLIAGPLDHIIASNQDPKNQKYLSIIEKNTKRLLSLVDQLITFRKAEQGFVSLNFSKNTLGDFIYPTTEAFEDYAIEKNINFFYKVNLPNENIVIDTEKIERVLFNLLSNSFKNTPANGSISIESDIIYHSGQRMIKMDVVDNGKGIPAEDLDNVFERFYQLGNEEDTVSGGGIGLSFCKSIINLLKGEITVTSEPLVETRFSILIPAGDTEDYSNIEDSTKTKSFIKDWVPLSTEYKSETLNETTINKNKKHHLLIVEDEEDIQNFLTNSLSEKYNISIASNGLEGLEEIKLKEPTLIISDVMMPEMDGFAFCKEIKSNTETCHIPVLLLTALGDNEDVIKGLEFGADEYISKPFSMKHLALRIDRLIDNSIKIKEYFSKNSVLPNENIELSTRDQAFLEDVNQVLDNNISDSDFGVVELSSKMNLSASQFYRRLKQLTGQLPNAYLRNFRLQKAAELLSKNDGTNVNEVKYKIGIESNSYFSTSFKKLYGVSPSEFLKRNSFNNETQS